MMHEADSPITAGSRTFADLDELRAYVSERIGRGIYAPTEIAAILALDRLDGDGVPFLREIARNLTFITPTRDRYDGPTPLDNVVAKAEVHRAAKELAHEEANRVYRTAVLEAEGELSRRRAKATTTAERSEIDGWHERQARVIAGLHEDYQAARREYERAISRLNSLKAAQGRWRQEQDVRIHNPDDPERPFTLAEFTEMRRRGVV